MQVLQRRVEPGGGTDRNTVPAQDFAQRPGSLRPCVVDGEGEVVTFGGELRADDQGERPCHHDRGCGHATVLPQPGQEPCGPEASAHRWRAGGLPCFLCRPGAGGRWPAHCGGTMPMAGFVASSAASRATMSW